MLRPPTPGQLARVIDSIVQARGYFLIDGATATSLEARGCTLHPSLWSAGLVATDPGAIRQLHLDYLKAGADCITTVSYQASAEGLLQAGFTDGEVESLLRTSVDLALEARQQFFDSGGEGAALVAASIGPFGAMRADGSEYRGNYGVDASELYRFHAERLRILAHTPADILACETIPDAAEAGVLLELMGQYARRGFWLSLSCPNGESLADGTPVETIVSMAADTPNLVAIGFNCMAPEFACGLIHRARQAAPDMRVLVYPNSGEVWNASQRCWQDSASPAVFAHEASHWLEAGACLIGGCCRTTPETIAGLRASA